MVDVFVVTILIGYYIDYKNEKKIYGRNGQVTLYILLMIGILFIVLRNLFF